MKAKVHCPNPNCEFHNKPKTRFYRKKGYFTLKHNQQKVPCYQCRSCNKRFSSRTFYTTYRQNKPHLNEPIFRLYCSATTQRRIAKLLKINRKTVVRKFLFLAQQAELEHKRRLHERCFNVSHVQFDEMLSFEHTRLKPVSIALAVEKETFRIVDIQVAQSHYQGRLSAIALAKYGPREDKSGEARRKVFNSIRSQMRGSCYITTDEKVIYRLEIEKQLPEAKLLQVKNRGGRLKRLLCARRRNEKDSLFELNLMAARIRHDLSRMMRKSWVTTKLIDRLQKHLYLFIAYEGDYSIAA